MLFLNNNSTIYAYAIGNEGNKSNIVTQNLTINDSTNGTVSIAYYCSKSGRYQTSSSCSYTFNATATSNCTNYFPSGSLHNSKCYKLILFSFKFISYFITD